MVMKVNMNWMAFFQANLDGDNSAKPRVESDKQPIFFKK